MIEEYIREQIRKTLVDLQLVPSGDVEIELVRTRG